MDENEKLRSSLPDLLRSRLAQIDKESSLSNDTAPLRFRERYSILTLLAKDEGKTELDVIEKEIDRINNKEKEFGKEFSEAYKKELGALNSTSGEKYEDHLKVVEEYESIGISEDWIPPFSAQRIFLNMRKEQLEDPRVDMQTAISRAYAKEAVLINIKANKTHKDSSEYKTLRNASAFMRAQSRLLSVIEIPQKPSHSIGK